MKYRFLIFLLVFSASIQLNAQERRVQENGKTYLIHVVQRGETIFSLSKTYSVDKKELLNANPNLIFGLKTGEDLKIPVTIQIQPAQPQAVKQPQKPLFHSYKVKRRDGLHFIAQRYGVEVDDILKYNPELEKKGLKRGMVLQIPDVADLERIRKIQIQSQKQEQEKPKSLGQKTHRVVGDETLYSISKKYNCTISSLLEANPEAKSGLRIGMVLAIPLAQQTVEQKPEFKGGYFTHLVETGETFWGMERKYHVSREVLVQYNPVLQNGLLAGLRIKIPVSTDVPDIKVEPVDQAAFQKHGVAHGETLYGLANQYQVSVSDLKKANPVLNYRGLLAGETVLIPKQTEAADQQMPMELPGPIEATAVVPNHRVRIIQRPMPENCLPDVNASFQKYNVALLLPLYLAANDTVNRVPITREEMVLDSTYMSQFNSPDDMPEDTFKIRKEKIIYPRSENFVHFYEGVLLAVDSLQHAGMNIELHVFDTNQDKAVVDSLVQAGALQGMDLIIGPVFPNLQGSVANFALANQIPMVSPLSSSGNFESNNPFYYKVNPTKEYLIRQTADYIGDEYFNKNLVVLQMGEYKYLPEATLVDLCREKFFSSGYGDAGSDVRFNEYNFKSDGYWGLRRVLSKKRDNVFIIPAETEAQVSVGVTNINSLSEDYPVTLVGFSNFQRFQSIQPDYFHHVNLHLLSPYFVDYHSKTTNDFILRFRNDFSTEPNKFSFQGYDVSFYFMSGLFRFGRDFEDCLPSLPVDLTQGEFYFDKVNRNGGYMNHGLFVVDYKKNYKVAATDIRGIPSLLLSDH